MRVLSGLLRDGRIRGRADVCVYTMKIGGYGCCGATGWVFLLSFCIG